MVDLQSHYRGDAGQVLARRVIDLLAAHGVPTSPPNYEVWISHALGSHPDLSRDIQKLLTSAQTFTDSVNEALYDRHFAQTGLTLEMIENNESIARELSGVVSTLRDAGDQSGAYADTLDQAVDTLAGATQPADLRAVLTNIAAATARMAANNRQLCAQMEHSSRQVETLQTALHSVRIEALTDSLTGLANRRMFDEVVRRRLAEAQSAGASLCLLMCDIDHFKRFNDTWGHPVGDQVIRFIGAVLRQHAAGDYLAARYGGEEFAIVMPRTHLADAEAISSTLLQSIRSRRLTRRSTGDLIGEVTMSIGLAQHRPGESVADLIGRADACLYASKRNGRDRVTTDADALMVAA